MTATSDPGTGNIAVSEIVFIFYIVFVLRDNDQFNAVPGALCAKKLPHGRVSANMEKTHNPGCENKQLCLL
jgi:hypothetical protein